MSGGRQGTEGDGELIGCVLGDWQQWRRGGGGGGELHFPHVRVWRMSEVGSYKVQILCYSTRFFRYLCFSFVFLFWVTFGGLRQRNQSNYLFIYYLFILMLMKKTLVSSVQIFIFYYSVTALFLFSEKIITECIVVIDGKTGLTLHFRTGTFTTSTFSFTRVLSFLFLTKLSTLLLKSRR